MKKRILVTGATGLIGRELAKTSITDDYDVYAITSRQGPQNNTYQWISANLFNQDEIGKLIANIRPHHLLHLAWATTEDYLSSPINQRFLDSGISLAQQFASYGGQRAVFAGSCLEYKFKDAPLKETDELDVMKYEYTRCKHELHQKAAKIFRASNVEFAYCRIFYVFGHGEHPKRLTPSVIHGLRSGQGLSIKSGPLQKDYMYSREIARAFLEVLNSSATGTFNICSGNPISIRDYALTIAHLLNRENLLSFDDSCTGQPAVILGDNSRLTNEIGFVPSYTTTTALAEILKEG